MVFVLYVRTSTATVNNFFQIFRICRADYKETSRAKDRFVYHPKTKSPLYQASIEKAL